MRLWAIIVLVASGIGVPAHADQLDDAVAAERRDDCSTAVSIYRSLAAKGVGKAFERLGYFSEIGHCTNRDWVEAAKLYDKAADAGEQGATASLSFIGRNWKYMYFGKPIDPTVYALVAKAAKRGNAVAQVSLGAMNYPIGDVAYDPTIQNAGITGNLQEAILWYRRAADQGDVDALVKLGVAYSEGIGVPQDYVEAHKFFNVAAPRVSNPRDADIRGNIIRHRDELTAKMTPSQIAEAQRLARDWKPKKE
jgi:TPR repeat protein